MPLVHNNNLSVYSGVSKQAVELRHASQCEEMINCYPTIENGVRRRNPTVQISDNIVVEDNQFMHSYDRGLAGESTEQYMITIDRVNNLRVFDIVSNTYRTVNYSGNALKYLESSNPEIGFSAVTVKDTTFIANRDFIPERTGDANTTVNYSLLTFDMVGYSFDGILNSVFSNGETNSYTTKNISGLAPARIERYYHEPQGYPYIIKSSGATVTLTIDGNTFNYTVTTKSDGYNVIPESVGEFRMNIYKLISDKLGSGYSIDIDTNGKLYVYDLSGTAIASSVSISFPSSVNLPAPTVKWELMDYWLAFAEQNYGMTPIVITTGSTTRNAIAGSDYNKKAFVWIKQVSVDTAFPYTFYATLKETNGTVISTTSTASTTSSGVASAIKTWADGLADFSATSDGSVVKITRDSGTEFHIDVSDTYGSQASSSWKGVVTSMDDVPKSFPFKDTIVKIDGVNSSDEAAYWVKYDGDKWVEWRDPSIAYKINKDKMPHKLVRNADFTFTLSALDWTDILVGDDDSQSIPEFMGSSIKDIFFVHGRLGILTHNGISLSQQGNFYNFFRTTILQLLDDSAISTYIDSNRSVGLEYAVELQNNIILFGDKAQFRIDTTKGITPSSISVVPISGFEINRNVKPIASGDSVFFLVSKQGYSSLMEMNQTTISMNIRAQDVSVHIPTYIDSDIMQIVASQRDNCVFLRSRTVKDTLYVYKFYGTESEKAQQAWSKWIFGMNINSIFAFNKELYLFGSRIDSTVPVEEYPLVTVWDDTKLWIDETHWLETGLATSPSFEKMDIDSYKVGSTFKDNGTVRYASEIELSEWSLQDKKSTKEMRGNLLVKTIEISSEDNSSFYLIIKDKERNTSRVVPSIYTVNRKPFISGNSKNMNIRITSTNGDGFQINAISLEGQYNVRSKSV